MNIAATLKLVRTGHFVSCDPAVRWLLAGHAVLIAPVSNANSLQIGNFTGNFAESGDEEALFSKETPALQPFLSKFPTQRNREKILKKREIARCSWEICMAASGVTD
jgi:hypothetical protein